ncbi:MAG: TlpA disulfide reductase family protein [Bryobacteraceae bacterium]
MAPTAHISRRAAIKSCFVGILGTGALAALERGEPAPYFVARTIDGEKYTSESVKGKVVLIEFWATWCQYCKRDEPAIESVVSGFDKDGLVVLAVDMGEPRRKVKKYLEASPRSCKIVLAEDTTLAAICEARTYPLYVLIDREGNIAGIQHGAAGEAALRRLLSKAGLGTEG